MTARTRRFRLFRERADDRRHVLLQRRNPPPKIEAQVQRHLLVSRAPRVQTFAEIAHALDELALDERVHVFVGAVDEHGLAAPPLENIDERRGHLLGLGLAEHTRSGKPLHPREAARHIVFEKTPIEPEGGSEFEGNGIGLAAETS